MEKKKFLVIQAVLIIGMLISLFLVYEHFSPSASKYCSFGASLDCGIVNKSPYANIDGIFYLLVIDFGLNLPFIDISGISPFFDLITSQAFLGFLTLIAMSIMTGMLYKKKIFFKLTKDKTIYLLKGISIFGVLYGFYLFLIQHYILKTYCIFCLSLDIVLLTLAILYYRLK